MSHLLHRTHPEYLSDDLERLQKRALRIIHPDRSYRRALEQSKLPTLYERREENAAKLFNDITTNKSHRLHNLLPPKNNSNYQTRRRSNFALPSCKTNRTRNSFMISHIYNIPQNLSILFITVFFLNSILNTFTHCFIFFPNSILNTFTYF